MRFLAFFILTLTLLLTVEAQLLHSLGDKYHDMKQGAKHTTDSVSDSWDGSRSTTGKLQDMVDGAKDSIRSVMDKTAETYQDSKDKASSFFSPITSRFRSATYNYNDPADIAQIIDKFQHQLNNIENNMRLNREYYIRKFDEVQNLQDAVHQLLIDSTSNTNSLVNKHNQQQSVIAALASSQKKIENLLDRMSHFDPNNVGITQRISNKLFGESQPSLTEKGSQVVDTTISELKQLNDKLLNELKSYSSGTSSVSSILPSKESVKETISNTIEDAKQLPQAAANKLRQMRSQSPLDYVWSKVIYTRDSVWNFLDDVWYRISGEESDLWRVFDFLFTTCVFFVLLSGGLYIAWKLLQAIASQFPGSRFEELEEGIEDTIEHLPQKVQNLKDQVVDSVRGGGQQDEVTYQVHGTGRKLRKQKRKAQNILVRMINYIVNVFRGMGEGAVHAARGGAEYAEDLAESTRKRARDVKENLQQAELEQNLRNRRQGNRGGTGMSGTGTGMSTGSMGQPHTGPSISDRQILTSGGVGGIEQKTEKDNSGNVSSLQKQQRGGIIPPHHLQEKEPSATASPYQPTKGNMSGHRGGGMETGGLAGEIRERPIEKTEFDLKSQHPTHQQQQTTQQPSLVIHH